MVDQLVLGINLLINVFGVLSCFYILMNNSINKRTAVCVIPVCLLGLIWFGFFYAAFLNTYPIHIVEVTYKLFLLFITREWIKNNYRIKRGGTKYARF